MQRRVGAILVLLSVALIGTTLAQEPAFQWNIPAPFPKPFVPGDNAMSYAKVELGRRLFYDTRLSVNRQQSCGSCHRQELAFTDGKANAVGTTGESHPRGSMSLANVAYNPALTWANPNTTTLEQQALVPMMGTHPVELGLSTIEARFLGEISADTLYKRLLPRAFPGDGNSYTMTHVTRSIAAFERTMISLQSPYDRYRYGNEPNAISESAKRGETFFFSGQRGSCFQCHGGWNFNGDVSFDTRPNPRVSFFNTGLYNVAGNTSYPATNTGLHEITKRAEDVGKFRAPTLRNVAVTAPYMHDGSIRTLAEVIDHYAAGGRSIVSGANAGVGRDNPNKAPSVHGFSITPDEKADLIAFLESLTDSTFLRNPALSNPWAAGRAPAAKR
jgi:cytochrome c peroxidase